MSTEADPKAIVIDDTNREEILKAAEDAAAAAAAAAGTGAPPESKPEDTPDPAAQEVAENDDAEPKAEGDEDADIKIVKQEAEEATGLDLEPAFQEYAETGTISDETREPIRDALEKAGFKNPDQMIDQYMAGAEASVQNLRNSAFEAAGGKDQYMEMIAWAGENLSDEDAAAFNEAVDNPRMQRLAVQGLQAQFHAASGSSKPSQSSAPQRAARPNVTSAVEPITSDLQVSELVTSDKYLNDPGFRAEVDRRIAHSMKAGLLKSNQ